MNLVQPSKVGSFYFLCLLTSFMFRLMESLLFSVENHSQQRYYSVCKLPFYFILASVPALSCRCMTYAYLNFYVSYVFYSYSYMPTCSLLWLPAVYFGYLYSTMAIPLSLPSVLSSLLYTATLLHLPSLYYNCLCAQCLVWHYLLSLPMLLSALLTYSCISCVVYT